MITDGRERNTLIPTIREDFPEPESQKLTITPPEPEPQQLTITPLCTCEDHGLDRESYEASKLTITPPCTVKTKDEIEKAMKPGYVKLNWNKKEPSTNKDTTDPTHKEERKKRHGPKQPSNVESIETDRNTRTRIYYQNVADVIDSHVVKVQEMIDEGADRDTIAEDLLSPAYSVLTNER
ncbi:hypothetical protein R1sor_023903 [Riccia sorocarpa]|uniref:Uncharacterized protein n=1 Tax=Riccia sorocarpa TaxID=122646 RepID=A0ABD3GRZ9_9MARC